MSEKKVTNTTELADIEQGEVVDLPPFLEGKPFVARLRKPSLLGLASKGAIPNPLLPVAEGLFNGHLTDQGHAGRESRFQETAKMFKVIAEHALIEPSYAALEARGIDLTDMQFLAIFNYTQLGVSALAGFREVEANHADHRPKQTLSEKTE